MAVDSVLLASGVSSRFQKYVSAPKQTVMIGGVPLICYPIVSMSLAGVGEQVIVVNRDNAHAIREAVERCPYFTGYLIYVLNNEIWRDNGYSALLGLEVLMGRESSILISVTDHIYPSTVPEALIESPHAPAFGGDSSPVFVDVGEATKIGLSPRGAGYVFSKKLTEYSFIDIGVHKITRLPLYGKCLSYTLSFSSLLTCVSNHWPSVVVDVRGTPWIDVDTYQDYLELLNGRTRTVIDAVWRDWEEKGVKR